MIVDPFLSDKLCTDHLEYLYAVVQGNDKIDLNKPVEITAEVILDAIKKKQEKASLELIAKLQAESTHAAEDISLIEAGLETGLDQDDSETWTPRGKGGT